MMLLSDIDEQPQAQQSRFALFDLGFRPFYLLASVFAALSIPLWSLQFSGMLGYSYLSGPLWHAHEMMFGFTLAVIAGFVHLSQLTGASLAPWFGIQVALDVVLFILAVMGGRVIPMFTNNGVPGATATRNPYVEKAALGLVLVLMAADAVGLNGALLAVLAGAACVAHAWRFVLWQPWRTRSVPIVWVLHLAYLWVPVHLALRVLSAYGSVMPSAATHALTVGAVGGLIIGMMTRTARGHTGRPLRADGFDTACYVLLLLAAVVRVALPLVVPAHIFYAVLCSAVLWSGGFGLYAVRYWPVLSRARLDGRPG